MGARMVWATSALRGSADPPLVGVSEQMNELRQRIERVARSNEGAHHRRDRCRQGNRAESSRQQPSAAQSVCRRQLAA